MEFMWGAAGIMWPTPQLPKTATLHRIWITRVRCTRLYRSRFERALHFVHPISSEDVQGGLGSVGPSLDRLVMRIGCGKTCPSCRYARGHRGDNRTARTALLHAISGGPRGNMRWSSDRGSLEGLSFSNDILEHKAIPSDNMKPTCFANT